MLNRVDFPLTRNQISDFILEKEYTNFLTLQQAISELLDAFMIQGKSSSNRTLLAITDEGKETLEYFENRIGDGIKEDICAYLSVNKFALRNESSVQSNYYKSTQGEFEVELLAKEKGQDLIHLKISVPVEDIAISVCDNWQKKYQEIYRYLTSELF